MRSRVWAIGFLILCLPARAGILVPVPLDVACVSVPQGVALQRADGTVLGDTLTQQECEAVVLQSKQGVVCARFSGSWFPTLYATARTLGQAVSFAECQSAVAAGASDLVCSRTQGGSRPWRPTHTTSGHAFGRFGTSLADCTELTANAAPGVVCTNTGTYNFQGRKPTVVDDKPYGDANLLGASGQQAYCTKATREARNGFVCACNGDFCGARDWILYDLARRRSAGGTSDIDSCIQAQGP